MAANARVVDAERRETRAKFATAVGTLLALQPEMESVSFADYLLIVVPSLESNLVKQPRERIDEFKANLQDAANRAAGEIQTEHEREMLLDTFHEDSSDDSENLVANACSTCRGECCLSGAGHAFLKSTELARRLVLEPDQTPETLVDDYMSRIPEYAYQDSCVFHGEQGCVLPREIRSSTCNSFLCTGISDVMRTEDETASKPTLVAAMDDRNCRRSAVMIPDGTRQEFAINKPLPDESS